MTKRTRPINDCGIGYAGIENEKMRDIRIYHENGRVQIWVEVAGYNTFTSDLPPYEALQYLNPIEAMAFSKALARCAIEALKDSAEP